MFKILEHLRGMVDNFRVQPNYAMQFIGLQAVVVNNVLHYNCLTTFNIFNPGAQL